MTAGSRTFRRAAVERQSTPDRLDELLVVATPRNWIGIAAVIGLVAGAALWAVVGSMPLELRTTGIVRRDTVELYLDAAQATRVGRGMPVLLAPEGTAAADGYMVGRVGDVRGGDSTTSSIAFVPMSTHWTTGAAGRSLAPNTGVHARIELARRRPISVLLADRP